MTRFNVPRRGRFVRPSGDREAGFTLIEQMVALVLFSVLSLGILGGTLQLLRVSRDQRAKSAASGLAVRQLEIARLTDAAALQQGRSTFTFAPPNAQFPYTVTQDVTFVQQGSTTGPCAQSSGASPNLSSLRIVETVTWPGMRVSPVSQQTVVTPMKNDFASTTNGDLAVNVLDASGNGAASVTVSLTGGTVSTTQVTDSAGCAFFAYQPTGNYTITLSATGYVNTAGSSAPTQTAGVQSSKLVKTVLNYDRAAELLLSWGTDTAHPVPAGMPITLNNANQLPGPSKVFTATTPTAGADLNKLFPFASGYGVWAGDCSDAQPATALTVAAPQGGSTSATVPVAPIDVTVSGAAAGVAVLAKHAADTSCTTAEQYPLGTTDATGAVHAALPAGTWTITAGAKNASVPLTVGASATSVVVGP